MSVFFIIVEATLIFATIVLFYNTFITTKTNDKKEIILNYLIYAVAMAEKIFGSGTGQLKLAKVYNDFVKDMPTFARFISYENFCKLVDQALDQLQDMLKNKTIDEIINKKKE